MKFLLIQSHNVFLLPGAEGAYRAVLGVLGAYRAVLGAKNRRCI